MAKISLSMLLILEVMCTHKYTLQSKRTLVSKPSGRMRLKCDGTRAETRFRLSAKRTSPFKSVRASLQAAEVCASAVVMVVMLDTQCSEVVWRVLATHSIRQFPLHFATRASSCAITFQLDSTYSTRLLCPTVFRPSVLLYPSNRHPMTVPCHMFLNQCNYWGI
jgi:hypothetical protein